MENKWKRFLSLLLALTMVIGLMPPIGHVHAEEETVVTLEQVTAVEENADYVIRFAGTTRAMANSIVAWGNGNGLDTGEITAPTPQYTWTLVPVADVEGGYKLYNAAVSKYISVTQNNAALNETVGDVFKFTYTDSGFVIKAEGVEYGYFNNLGGTNKIGGWNGDGTKFDIYKVVEKTLDEVDPWGKRFWTKVSVDTETVYDANEGLFEYAWDNNSATIWHSNWQGASDKLDEEGETFAGEIDFGEEYTINWFSFTPRQGDNPSGLVTQASLYVKDADDADWTQVAQSAAFAADQSEKKISFDEQAVRYVRFVAEASNDGWVAVSEFNIGHEHTEPEPESPFTTEQITGITGTASSNDANDGSNIEEAFDGIKGETGNYWASVNNANGIEGNEYLIADLGGTYTINKVQYTKRYDSTALYNCTGNLNDYIIWVSTDGNTWTQVANGTTMDGTTEITFSAVQASHVKLTATSSYHWQEVNRNKVMTVGEFEVFKVVCVTHTPGEAATCTTAQTCTVCYAELAPATGHVNTETTGAKKPTLCEPGSTGTTVCECGHVVSEAAAISQLPVANVLNGDTLIALNTCEYTYTSDSDGTSFTYPAADGAVYYVKPSANGAQIPQSTTVFTGLALHWQTDGTVQFSGNGSIHFWTTKDEPYWDKCGNGSGSVTGSDAVNHNLYIFKPGDGTDIPGYTQVTSAEGMISGETYLIAAKNNAGNWYVMHPSASAEKFDHIAQVSGELRTAAHTPGEAVTENNVEPTPDADGSYDTVVYCTVCGAELSRVTTIVPATEHTAGEAVIENEVDATCTEDGSYDSVVYCTDCNEELSRETITVPATGHQNTEIVGAVAATLTTEGYTGDTYCRDCDTTIATGETIPVLTVKNAQPLMGSWSSGIVSLSDCEYTLSGTEGAYSLCHGGYYYVKPAASGNGIPQQNVPFTGITLAFQDNGKVRIGGNGHIHVHNAGTADPDTANPYWDKCGTAHGDANNGTDELYLFKANANSTNTAIPGYEPVTSVTPGESYLIAFANKAGEWFVMYPSTEAVSIAKVVTDAATHTHAYSTTTQAATCTATGLKTDTCDCGHIHTEVIPADPQAHTAAEAVIENETEATCTTDGSYDTVTYCSVCNEEVSRVTTTVPATGHTPGEEVVENEVAPTLNSTGSYESVVYCTVCNAELSRETVTVPALTGAVAQIGQVKYATFEDALANARTGDTIVLLDANGIEITEDTTYNLSGLTVESAGDVFVVTNGTLTLNGSGTVKGGTSDIGSWTAVWANGGHVIINGGTYSVGGDSTASDPNHQNDVIYTKNGGTVTIYGGTFLNDGTVWTLNENDANRGTITVYGGSFENWNPGDNVSEGAGTSFLAEGYCAAEQDGIYTVQAHAYESVVTAPTCTEAGYTTYTCTFCGDSYIADEVAAPGHTAGEAVTENEVAATCTTDGSYDTVTYCSVCNEEVSRVTTTVPATGHTEGEEVTENEVAATCTTDGSYDTVTYCSVCNEEVSRVTTTVPATGHTESEAVIENEVSPTLNSTGSYDTVVYCSVCDAELSRETTVVPELTGGVAQVGETKYATFEEALEAAKTGEVKVIQILTQDGIEITEDTTYDLSGLTVESAGDVFVVTNGTLTLNGSGTVKGGTDRVGSWTAVWANGGHVVINGGTYAVGGDSEASDRTHQNDVIYTKNGGTVTINGGSFLNDGTVWTLNENDANRGTITVYGGSFENWNPGDNVSEGAGTSFLADGYCAAEQDSVYTVQAHAYESVVTAPTCTDVGYTTYTCTFCSDSYTADEVAATGHTYEAVVTAPTCTEGGYTTYTCGCGDSYTGDETEALGHSFTDGTCTLCGTGIAVNMTTGNTYAVLADALNAAEAGDIVKLLGNADEGNVLVYPDITLDLNGYELTAKYVVGFTDSQIVDNAGSGKLITEERNIVLDVNNTMIPLYDGSGYIFTKVGFAIAQDTDYTGTGVKINALVCPQSMNAVELLKNGGADSKIRIEIRLSWDAGNGIRSQSFVFKDEVVKAVFGSNNGTVTISGYGQMFTMFINGTENVENLKASIAIVSDTGVERTTRNSISIN